MKAHTCVAQDVNELNLPRRVRLRIVKLLREAWMSGVIEGVANKKAAGRSAAKFFQRWLRSRSYQYVSESRRSIVRGPIKRGVSENSALWKTKSRRNT